MWYFSALLLPFYEEMCRSDHSNHKIADPALCWWGIVLQMLYFSRTVHNEGSETVRGLPRAILAALYRLANSELSSMYCMWGLSVYTRYAHLHV
jgi:hypothetical protein